MPMSPDARSKSDAFDVAVGAYEAKGTLIVEDAMTPLDLVLKKSHIAAAKRCDESHCVVAQMLSSSQVGFEAASVGRSIIKILFKGGRVLRYRTSKPLKEGVIRFDTGGDWGLKPGVYTLGVLPNHDRLAANQSDEYRRQRNNRWRSFRQVFNDRQDAGEVGGEGNSEESILARERGNGGRIRGEQVPGRQVTVVTGRGRRRKKD